MSQLLLYWMNLISRVVYHLYAPPLAGIGKLPALAGWYIWLVFLYCKLWQEHLLKITWELRWNSFFPQKGGKVYKKGAEAPFFLGKRGLQTFL